MKSPWLVLSLGALVLAPLPLTNTNAHADLPPADSLSLRGAIEQALHNNRTLLSADIDIDVADANLLSAVGVEDFEVDGNLNFQDLRTSAVAGNPFSQTANDDLHVDASVNKSLDYGGRFGIKIGGDYIRTGYHVDVGDGMPYDLTTTAWNPTIALTYAQSLLRGSGEIAFLQGERRAVASRDVAVLERENVAANTVRDIVEAYWELAYAAKELAIHKESLGLAREQLRITQARLDVGVGAPTDVAAVQQTIATRMEDVLISEQNVAARALDVRLLLGTELKPGHLALDATDELNLQPREMALADETQSAVDHNPQIAEVQARGRLAQVDVDVTENGLLPQLDLTASLGPLGNSVGASDSVKQLVEFDNFQVAVGLKFTAPIENRNARGAHAAAQHTLHKVKVSEEDLRAQIVIGVQRNYDTVHAAQERILVDAEATKYAHVNLDAEHARFDVGRSTNYDVLLRQDALAQSELREARARADYLRSLAALQALTGELFAGLRDHPAPAPGRRGERIPVARRRAAPGHAARRAPRSAVASAHDPHEPHVNPAFHAVAAEGKEALAVAARAGRAIVDVLGANPGALEQGPRGDPQIDVLLLRPVDDEPRHARQRGLKGVHDLGADLEAARPDRRPEGHAHVGRARAEALAHGAHRVHRHAGHRAAPASVRRRDDTPDRIGEDDRDAVGGKRARACHQDAR